jgi:hypothetical protein
MANKPYSTLMDGEEMPQLPVKLAVVVHAQPPLTFKADAHTDHYRDIDKFTLNSRRKALVPVFHHNGSSARPWTVSDESLLKLFKARESIAKPCRRLFVLQENRENISQRSSLFILNDFSKPQQ